MSMDKDMSKEEFMKPFKEKDELWKPSLRKGDELLNRHPWIKSLVEGGGSATHGYDPKDERSQFERYINPKPQILENTEYQVDIKDKRYVHFTSFDAFKEIMSSGLIRLYNPHYGNDPNEFIHSSEPLYDVKPYIKINREDLFILSLNEEYAKEDLTMWKLYGKEGYGVGLVIEFENPIENWVHWYFGRVMYGDDHECIDKLDAFHKDLLNTQKEIGESPKLDINISPIYAFNKSGLFHSENEVRLLFYGRHPHLFGRSYADNNIPSYVTKSSLNGQKVQVRFLEYPIYWQDKPGILQNKFAFKQGPQIRLREVVLGHHFTEQDKNKISDWCAKVLDEQFHRYGEEKQVFPPEVSLSPLKDYFKSKS